MSKKPQVTPWFPVKIKPVRVGLYEVRYPESPDKVLFRYWDGKDWSLNKRNSGGTLFGVYPKDAWRGLAEQPKEPK